MCLNILCPIPDKSANELFLAIDLESLWILIKFSDSGQDGAASNRNQFAQPAPAASFNSQDGYNYRNPTQ